MGIADTRLQPPAATRKDLLALGSSALGASRNVDVSLRWLRDLGFAIMERSEGHWILTHTAALPELHFYSALELEQFARHRAHHYAKRSLQENCA